MAGIDDTDIAGFEQVVEDGQTSQADSGGRKAAYGPGVKEAWESERSTVGSLLERRSEVFVKESEAVAGIRGS